MVASWQEYAVVWPRQPRKMISTNHRNAGQNVLYYDGHVEWQETSACGLNGDNIWHRNTLGALSASDSYVVQN